jgi:citrate lyase subunit beta / citryl-CoA lyase
MTLDISAARTFLFVPGDRPDRFGKAAAAGADVIVLDLEDGVLPDRKQEAREHAHGWLRQRNQAVVRINAEGTPWHADDADMTARNLGAVLAVMVPKAEDPERLAALSQRLPAETPLVPLLETANGIAYAQAICATAGVVRPAFGSVDLAAQLGVDHRSHGALQHARSALVLAAAASELAAPVDGVTTNLADDSSLRTDLEHAVMLGFTGKLCIHPRQVAVANELLSPSAADVEWARQVITAAKGSSVTVQGGHMVDRPVLLRAQAVLARAFRLAQEG